MIERRRGQPLSQAVYARASLEALEGRHRREASSGGRGWPVADRKMPRVHVCTIVSRSSLARVRVMADTLREHHPRASLTLLLLDADPDELEGLPGVRVLTLEELVGEQGGLLAAGNPPAALEIALLAPLACEVMESGDGSAIYIDAGQRVLGDLAPLLTLSRAHQVALVAHPSLSSADADGRFAAELGGAFSYRVLALRSGAASAALLEAWPRYLAGDREDGTGSACAWLDGVPARAQDVGILRTPGFILDLPSLAAALTRGALGEPEPASALRLGGQEVSLLDLREIDPDHLPPWLDRAERVPLESAPAIRELVVRHAEDLRNAGWQAALSQEVPFTHLDDGLRLTPTLRTLFVEAVSDGDIKHSPFTPRGRAELYEYLMQPGARGRACGLTRLHMAIWQSRPDLQASYPHIDGPDGPGFAGWLCRYGTKEEGLVGELLPPTPPLAYRDADPHVHQQEPRWGVNVVGFLTAELGVGEAARLLLAGLDAQGVPALPVQGRLMPPSRHGVDFSYAHPDEAAYPINILCINGDGVPVFAREAGRSFFEDRYTIGLWWWEAGEPPASWTPAYEFVDEVWVASQYIYDALAPGSPVPVVRVRLPVVTPEPARRTRAELDLPQDGFLFLCMYDYHSVAVRKNPIGVIDAFRRAFPTSHGAKLVLKSINAQTHPGEHALVVAAARGRDDITLLDRYLGGADKNAMIAASDCCVSLHRSEGFGIALAEAMLLEKPVIATAYGGALEYMSHENAYLVDWRAARVGEGAYPYAPEAVWAEPDLDHAAELMRTVFDAPEQARARGRVARRDVLERHAPSAAGAIIKRRLELIHGRLYDQGARTLNLAHLLPLSRHDELRAMIGDPPVPDRGAGVLGRLKSRAHRPIANWAREYVKHQRTIDDETQLAIKRIDDRLSEVGRTLQDEQKAQHAETLAVLRHLEAELVELRRATGAVEGSS